VSKRSLAQWRQTSLTQAYKNLFPDTTSASIQAVTTLKSSLNMYLFFVYNNFFSHCLFFNSSPEVTFRIALISLGFSNTFIHISRLDSVVDSVVFQGNQCHK
jgi:hypothetical protein